MASTPLDYVTSFGFGSLIVAWFFTVSSIKRNRRYNQGQNGLGVVFLIFIFFILFLLTDSLYLSIPRTSTMELLPAQRVIEPPEPMLFLKYPSRARPGETLEMKLTMTNLNQIRPAGADIKLLDYKTGRLITSAVLSLESPGTVEKNVTGTMPGEDLTIEVSAIHWSWMGESRAKVTIEKAGLDVCTLLLIGIFVSAPTIALTKIVRKRR